MQSENGKTESEWDVFVKRCREFFRELDTNGDGRLDRSEFAAMIQRIGLKLSNYDIQKAFNRTDKNQDGSISFREFVDYYSKELCSGFPPGMGKTKENRLSGSPRHSIEDLDKKKRDSETDKILVECRNYFRDLDTDRNGKLDKKEFFYMLNQIGINADGSCMQRAFGNVDKDADGGITFREFVQYYDIMKAEKRSETKSSVSPRQITEDLDKKKRDSEIDKILVECRNYFRDLDTDGNGKLDKKEFSHMLNQIGIKADVSCMQRAFGHVDKDADGGITFREFIKYYNIMKAEKRSEKRLSGSPRHSTEVLDKKKRDSETDKILVECRNYFRDLDTDGNGKLDKKEFSHMLNQIGIKADASCMQRAFGHVDKDADGGITFREFLQYYNIMKAEK